MRIRAVIGGARRPTPHRSGTAVYRRVRSYVASASRGKSGLGLVGKPSGEGFPTVRGRDSTLISGMEINVDPRAADGPGVVLLRSPSWRWPARSAVGPPATTSGCSTLPSGSRAPPRLGVTYRPNSATGTRCSVSSGAGLAYRATLSRLREAINAGDNLEAVDTARALIARVVIHPAPPRKPPSITIKGQFAAMLQAAQPGLPPQAAQLIAQAAHLAVEESSGGQSPLV